MLCRSPSSPRWLRSLAAAALLAASACQRHTAPAAATASACIDPAKVNPSAICTMLYDPVCGCDGKTYSNPCRADNAGVRTYTKGPCPGQ